ncbi:elongation factor P [Candidatus Phytoplasma phoenicium]|uniref:Elongation factor P n=1 Tax=Candidatus Phytoplasma phoenicium TaxID=198422 RepID=A0A0L0MK08_9MOLU|nr:elongation factor P [Candidatus Phytoplasma phoenicium]KND62586.1 Elongation factor P [Candidatus Phytoplasma phoenicium]
MINTNDFKIGQTIKFNNNIFQILEFLHVKPGKGSAFVRSKLKNLKNGEIIEHVFNAGVKIKTALVQKKKLQFSYSMEDIYVFCDNTTFETYEISKNQLQHVLKYLTSDMLVEILFDDQQEILTLVLPDKISLKVAQTDPATAFGNVKKNTSLKEAVLETGLIIKVPLFIEPEEKIIINTVTGLYDSRDNNK